MQNIKSRFFSIISMSWVVYDFAYNFNWLRQGYYPRE